jgi:CRISPR-associated protein Cas1
MSTRWWWMRPRERDVSAPLPAVATPVLHVEGPGRLAMEGGRLVVACGDGVRQLALLGDALELVVCHGPIDVSGACLADLAGRGVSLAFVSRDGSRLLSRLQSQADSRLPTRVAQTRVLLDERSRSRFASGIVAEKIRSQAAAARHYQRQGRAVDGKVLERLAEIESQAEACTDLDALMGLEGAASALWFKVLGTLFRAPWKFESRSRRPPRDPVNALLSLGYTLLHDRVATAAQAAGLEPALGALHAFRAGRMSLACDLMEPLRVPVVDRWVVAACNQRRFDPGLFEQNDGSCMVGRGQMPRVVADWERTWHESRWRSLLSQRVAGFVRDIRQQGERLGMAWQAEAILEPIPA